MESRRLFLSLFHFEGFKVLRVEGKGGRELQASKTVFEKLDFDFYTLTSSSGLRYDDFTILSSPLFLSLPILLVYFFSFRLAFRLQNPVRLALHILSSNMPAVFWKDSLFIFLSPFNAPIALFSSSSRSKIFSFSSFLYMMICAKCNCFG